MVIVYHGTLLNRGLWIAERGAILSPLLQQTERFLRMYRRDTDAFIAEYKMNPEAMAEKIVRGSYSEYEFEHRARCISVVVGEVGIAQNYADERRGVAEGSALSINGGLVLGIELAEEELKGINPKFSRGCTRFIPRLLPLDTLREVHLSPRAFDSNFALVRKAFDRYSLVYKLFE